MPMSPALGTFIATLPYFIFQANSALTILEARVHILREALRALSNTSYIKSDSE